jgi:hypothetical protein
MGATVTMYPGAEATLYGGVSEASAYYGSVTVTMCGFTLGFMSDLCIVADTAQTRGQRLPQGPMQRFEFFRPKQPSCLSARTLKVLRYTRQETARLSPPTMPTSERSRRDDA